MMGFWDNVCVLDLSVCGRFRHISYNSFGARFSFKNFLIRPIIPRVIPLASFGAVATRFEAILWRAAWKFEDHEWFAS